ncbi:putative DNA primase-helicase subunit [Cronobacter phage S13]|jgi:replicative DNA helicase|uniref:DnaB-like replicative helicase n=1 Tax=Cronobacter phage LPCS28 TaxID=2924885 RepID=A0AAE9G5C1_9CAUD|nr:putative DNA primase-helicase subunit [Cronobacter phage S13]YP_010665833.1 DnaB-like replicative helicase [Cronobacter phage LPCS28]AIA65050.1 putative DNA primase-helicase subunit [Cronobacter phage S13]UNY47022.1 DNA repair protein [Cronobacter phage LPCS28]
MLLPKTILSNVLYNSEYFSVVWPHLRNDYFSRQERTVFNLIKKYHDEHKSIPSKNALMINLESMTKISQDEFDSARDLINGLETTPEDLAWLVGETEKYCRDKAIYNATSRAIEIQENAALPLDEQDKRIPDLGAIPEILQSAISISFDTTVGHDFFEDYESRWEMYREKTMKIPFGIRILDMITKQGVERRTLNLLMAGVNVGKSLGLCHLAATYLAQGRNVLYVSMEMAEHMVAKRIDANLLDVSMDDIDDGVITYSSYKARMENLSKKGLGKLIIKQFPTGGASVNHINALLNELWTKRQWKPDIIIVDYLGIMASSRIKVYSENSYTLVKAIAEELRGLAIEHNVVVWSAAQTTRAGWDSSDINMSDIAESAGLAATADFILAMMETPDLAELGQQLFKQIKSRYGDKNRNNKFTMLVEKDKQRWLQCEDTGTDPKTVEQASREMQVQANENATQRKKMQDFMNADEVEWE